MKVILLTDVKGKGKKNQVIEVSDGYGNNYLLKNKLAVLYTKKSGEILNDTLEEMKNEEEKLIKEYESISNKLNDKTLVFKVKVGKNDKVFGTISSKQISDKLKDMGYEIDKKCIKIDGSISTLGVTIVEVVLHKKVKFNINIELVK